MATIRKRNGRWQVQIRRQGASPVSKTFSLKSDALTWSRQAERQVERGEDVALLTVSTRETLQSLIERYCAEVLIHKRSVIQETSALRLIAREDFASRPLSSVSKSKVAAYFANRLAEVKVSTVRRQFGVFRHLLTVASDDWKVKAAKDIASDVRIPTHCDARSRRLQEGEESALIASSKQCLNPHMEAIICFALESAMRQGEIVKIKHSHMNESLQTLLVPETKNGKPRTIPLSQRALQLIHLSQSHSDFVFPVTGSAIRQSWTRLKKRAGVTDLHFHDLRHEAISRLFERGLSMPEVQLISGHSSPAMLMRYTHLEAAKLVSKMG